MPRLLTRMRTRFALTVQTPVACHSERSEESSGFGAASDHVDSSLRSERQISKATGLESRVWPMLGARVRCAGDAFASMARRAVRVGLADERPASFVATTVVAHARARDRHGRRERRSVGHRDVRGRRRGVRTGGAVGGARLLPADGRVALGLHLFVAEESRGGGKARPGASRRRAARRCHAPRIAPPARAEEPRGVCSLLDYKRAWAYAALREVRPTSTNGGARSGAPQMQASAARGDAVSSRA